MTDIDGNDASCIAKWNDFLNDLSSQHRSLEPIYQDLVNTCDDEFKNRVNKIISTQDVLSYKEARHAMFSHIENNDGLVCSIYVDYCMKTNDIPNANVMNTEHAWPQSMGSQGIAKSDLHHLFPTESKVNSRRNNHPYCYVDNVTWEQDGSRLGSDAHGTKCFEPRDLDKGDIARAMLYFSVRYQISIDENQEAAFKDWILLDPVSNDEIERHQRIVETQNNRNPFIDHPEFSRFVDDF